VGAGAGTLRLFLAAPCPPALAQRLAQLQGELSAATWDLALSRADDFHLTLHYLGATPERVLDDLKKELGAVCHARRPFDLACGGLGCFPDDAEPRVVWAGLSDPSGKLQDLFQASRRVLNAYRLFQLRDGLVPHLTLARVRRLSAAWDPALLRGLAPQWAALGNYPVEKLCLMESVGGQEGPRYRPLAEFGLNP
jgi:2'-5' RNA ligase